MSIFANLPISRKLMAAFAAVIVVIFASSALVYDRPLVIEWVKNWRVHTADVLDTLQNTRNAIVDQETGVRGYLITGNENFLEPYHGAAMPTPRRSQKIKDLTSDNPAQQSRLDELNELAKEWRSRIRGTQRRSHIDDRGSHPYGSSMATPYPIPLQLRSRPLGKGHLWSRGPASFARPRARAAGYLKLACLTHGRVIFAGSTFLR